MTTYMATPTANQKVYITNKNDHTQITAQYSTPGQQQSHSNGLQTGSWVAPPTLYRTIDGLLVVRIDGETDQFFVQLTPDGLQINNTAPSLAGAEVMPLKRTQSRALNSFEVSDMAPLQRMNPAPLTPSSMPAMQMQLGSMPLQNDEAEGKAKFCAQCGTPFKLVDRYCSQCGHKLGS